MRKNISHRGNLQGPNSAYFGENNPHSIKAALQEGFDVEIDVWLKDEDQKFYLGHTTPEYPISKEFFDNDRIWIHCKDPRTLHALNLLALPNVFFHQNDDCVLTSQGYIWTYPRKEILLTNKSIAVMPEFVPDWDLSNAYGVCTDYPYRYVDR